MAEAEEGAQMPKEAQVRNCWEIEIFTIKSDILPRYSFLDFYMKNLRYLRNFFQTQILYRQTKDEWLYIKWDEYLLGV